MTVVPGNELYLHCHKCGYHADGIDIYATANGIPQKEAIEALAELLHIGKARLATHVSELHRAFGHMLINKIDSRQNRYKGDYLGC